MVRQERKIYFLYVRSESKVLQSGLGGSAGALGTCCCVQNGREKEKRKKQRNKNELSSIQLGEGTVTLQVRDLFIKGFLPLWIERKSHSSSACVSFLWVCMFACWCVQLVSESVSVNSSPPLSRAAKERWHFSFHISSFIPFFFSPPSISPRLPSSHPDQRTHRPLLGTPCPGNPPCTVKYHQCLQNP